MMSMFIEGLTLFCYKDLKGVQNADQKYDFFEFQTTIATTRMILF